MKLTTRGRYAVTAMLDLAVNSESGPANLATISTRQDISLSYLEQLFSLLRRRGLVQSQRGPGGGYLLAKEAEHISVADVIAAVNEDTDVTRCGGSGNCQHGGICLTHHLWMDLSDQIRNFLGDISLADLVVKNEVQAVARRQLAAADSATDDSNRIAASR
ncbi:MAG: Rrf2 family transcriptional regulator [Pseudomonadota bacterium]